MSDQQFKEGTDPNRRDFLKAGLGLAGLAIAPGVLLYGSSAYGRPSDEPASSKVRWGMLVDTTKCSEGCNACVTACNEINGLSGKTGPQDSQWIRKLHIQNLQTGEQHDLPVMCQHCEYPPCEDVCPTGATFKRADGIVLVDRHICIGCRYCMMACPYKARSFVHHPLHHQQPDVPRGRGCVEACTFCVKRVDEGLTPACVEACNKIEQKAILFGDLNDPNSEIAKAVKKYKSYEIRADLGLNTGVRYRGI